MIAVTLNTILLKQTRDIDNYAFFKNKTQFLNSYFATYTYPDFPETSLD